MIHASTVPSIASCHCSIFHNHVIHVIMHFQCCFSTHHSVGCCAWICSKVVYFLFSFVVDMLIILMLLFGFAYVVFFLLICLLWVGYFFFFHKFVFFSARCLFSGSSCSAAVAIHSLAVLLMPVHFLALQRNYINTQYLH